MEGRTDRREQNKGKERWNNNKYERKGIRLNREYSLGVRDTEPSGSEVSVQARGWSMGFEMFRVRREWSDVFGNDVHRFGNAY